jgi:acyl-CoA thioesterase-1
MNASSKRAPLRVTFFGDSICVGQGVSIFNGWVTRVAGRLEELGAREGRNIVVTNASVNGNTTRQALERMPYEVQSHGVDVLIVQFGLNDCNYWETDHGMPRVSPDGFAANLKEIVARGRKFGAQRILLHNNHPTTRDSENMAHTDKTYEDSNRQYNAIVRDVAAEGEEAVIFTDIEAAFRNLVGTNRERLAELLLDDGLHLSRSGHDLYFDVAAAKIERAVAELIDVL